MNQDMEFIKTHAESDPMFFIQICENSVTHT